MRALVALVLAAIVFTTLPATPSQAAGRRIFHVAAYGTTGATGADWDSAGSLEDIPRYIRQAEPGDEVWIRAGYGKYYTSKPIIINDGGDETAPVTIRGVTADGGTRVKPMLIGKRTAPYDPEGNPGAEVFRLVGGADNLEFRNLELINQGNGAIRVAAPISNLLINNIRATNVRRFFESYPASPAKTATVTGLQISNVTVDGFSKSAIRLRDNTSDVLIRDTVGDSQRQDRDKFAIGVHLEGTVHDVRLERVTMRNSHDTASGSYWNGDGFAAEDDTYDIEFVDTVATGSTDAGYDLKSTDTTLVRAVAEDNKRNYRFWGEAELIDSVGRDPHRRGGIGSQAQLWAGGNARVHVVNGTFTDASDKTFVFAVESRADVTLENTTYTKAPDALGGKVEGGAKLTFK